MIFLFFWTHAGAGAILGGMKIIHTSDWHLGARLHGQERGAEHDVFLAWLLDAIREERPDALLVSGDVFDVRQPAPAAQARYYNFLATLATMENRPKVVVTAGNHDSAAFLGAPRDLLKHLDIVVVPAAKEDPAQEVVPVRDAAGNLLGAVAAIPFISEGDLSNLARAAGLDMEDTVARRAAGFEAHCRAVLEAARAAAPGLPVAAMAHCFLTGAAPSDDNSEPGRLVGNLEGYAPGALAEADYVALGHLHRRQSLSPTLWYSGSPLAMSFAEVDQTKGALLVELEPGKAPVVRELNLAAPVPLVRLEGGTEVIREQIRALDPAHPAYVEVRVTKGEDDLAGFMAELDAQAGTSAVQILRRENARPRPAIESLAEVPTENTLRTLEPLEVAAMCLRDRGCSPAEQEIYLDMIRSLGI